MITWEERLKTAINSVKMSKASAITTLLNLVTLVLFQVHRRVIPSHTVYSANIERTLANMSHPSHDELEQNQLHKLEARRRYERLKQQRSLRL